LQFLKKLSSITFKGRGTDMDAKGLKKIMVVFFIFFLTFFSLNLPAKAAVPAAPAGLAAIAGNGEASLTWTAVSGATDYVLYRGTFINGPYDFVAQTQGTGHTNKGLSNGTPCYYVVTALNADGQSPYSSPIGATPLPTVLKAPDSLTAIPGNAQVSLAWNAVTSAVSYNILRGTSRGGPYTLLASAASGPSFTDRNLTNGNPYFYVVQTMSTNLGAYSEEVDATPSSLLPSAPSNFSASPGSTWAGLSWSPSDNAVTYAVFRGEKDGGPYSFVAQPNTTAYEDTGLYNGTTYYYVVAAVNVHGQSAYSAQVSAAVSAIEKPHASVISKAEALDKRCGITWENSYGAVSYTVYRSSTSGGPYESLGITTGSTYQDSGLTNGITYYYVVDSHNGSAIAARSNEVSITPAAQLPAPVNVTVVAGNTQATVTWNPVAGASNYKVLVATSPGGKDIASGWFAGPSYTATNLTNGQTYYFRVQSSGWSWSVDSAEVSTIPLATLPLAPTNLAITSGNTQLSLTWTAVSSTTDYKIYRRTEGSAWPTAPVGTSTGTHFTDTGLVNGTSYCYCVAAVNAIGTGVWSYEGYKTPVAKTTLAPTHVAVVAGNTQATVTWNPVVGARTYKVLVTTSPGGKEISGSDFLSGPSYTATNLTNGQTYYFKVQSSGSSWSAYSAEVSTIPLVTLPLAPTNPTITSGNTQLSLTWTVVSGATGYNIFRRTEENAWPASPVGTFTGTLFTDTGLVNGTKYYYCVAAVNAIDTGAWSDEKYSTPDARVTLAPANVAVVAGNTQATVTWDPVAGASYYKVFTAMLSGGEAISGSDFLSGPSYTATNLTNGQTYYFRVQSSGSSWSAYSAEVSATPFSPPGTGTISGHVSLNIAGFSNLAVKNAIVSLEGTAYSAPTDFNGNFILPNIPFGQYKLIISAPNMETASQDITLSEQNLPLTIPQMVISSSVCLKGDVNGDNRVGMDDAIYIMQMLTK